MGYEIRVLNDDTPHGLRKGGFPGGRPNLGRKVSLQGISAVHEAEIDGRGFSDFPRGQAARPHVDVYVDPKVFEDIKATGKWEMIQL